jgi:hypothetical protein
MARRKKNFIVVAIQGDKLVVETFLENVGDASATLLEHDEGRAVLLDGAVVPHKINREPTIIIGSGGAAASSPKKRGRKKKPTNNGAGEPPTAVSTWGTAE